MSEITFASLQVRDIPKKASVEVQTQSRTYTLYKGADGRLFISGHPRYCPFPVPVRVMGERIIVGQSFLFNTYMGEPYRQWKETTEVQSIKLV